MRRRKDQPAFTVRLTPETKDLGDKLRNAMNEGSGMSWSKYVAWLILRHGKEKDDVR